MVTLAQDAQITACNTDQAFADNSCAERGPIGAQEDESLVTYLWTVVFSGTAAEYRQDTEICGFESR
jgi:hypothetical protein